MNTVVTQLTMRSDMQEFQIVVDSWIIQDGNYGDFRVGDQIECAIEFGGGNLRPSQQRCVSVVHRGQNVYFVCAQVIYSEPDVWAIEFGLRAFEERRPPEFAVSGSWVEGEIELGIDPFFYKEHLCKLVGMPNLFNHWEVARIERDDTPWITSGLGRVFSRDQQNVRWTDVQQTDAWNDDDGRSAYLLHLIGCQT
jgi:hypothetical protein